MAEAVGADRTARQHQKGERDARRTGSKRKKARGQKEPSETKETTKKKTTMVA
jgi:hypothetical protein